MTQTLGKLLSTIVTYHYILNYYLTFAGLHPNEKQTEVRYSLLSKTTSFNVLCSLETNRRDHGYAKKKYMSIIFECCF